MFDRPEIPWDKVIAEVACVLLAIVGLVWLFGTFEIELSLIQAIMILLIARALQK